MPGRSLLRQLQMVLYFNVTINVLLHKRSFSEDPDTVYMLVAIYITHMYTVL